MSNKILVTDNLFIFDEHVKQMEAAGFEIERLDKPNASEEELMHAVKGKVGYLMGGVEHVTERVIDQADQLKALVFSGSDWAGYIPAHVYATKKGIAIANAPGANSYAVAEYTITLILMMLRHTLALGRTGKVNFMTTKSLADAQIGVVGLGRIGERVARMLIGLGAQHVTYWNRTRKAELEQELGIKYMELDALISSADVVTNHLVSTAGLIFDKNLLTKLKPDALLINTGSHKNFDFDTVFELLKQGKIRAAFDDNLGDTFNEFDVDTYFSSNAAAGYNTFSANKIASDMATMTLINLLKTGKDQYRVN